MLGEESILVVVVVDGCDDVVGDGGLNETACWHKIAKMQTAKIIIDPILFRGLVENKSAFTRYGS